MRKVAQVRKMVVLYTYSVLALISSRLGGIQSKLLKVSCVLLLRSGLYGLCQDRQWKNCSLCAASAAEAV